MAVIILFLQQETLHMLTRPWEGLVVMAVVTMEVQVGLEGLRIYAVETHGARDLCIICTL